MKLTIDKKDLQKIINLAERNSGKNTTLPILSAVLLKTSKNKATITSTNLETGFEASLPARVEKDGAAAIPAKPLLNLLSSTLDGELKLESSGSSLRLVSKNSSTNLKCFPYDDFPQLPKIESDNSFKIHSSELCASLLQTISASSSSQLKPELASVFIFSKNKTPLTFAATDSFRLSECRTLISTADQVSILIPQRSAQEVMKIFEDENGEIEVSFNKSQALFKSKNTFFLTRLNDGNFPDYQMVVPKSFATQVVIDKAGFLGAVRAASVFSSRLSDVVLKASVDDGVLEVNSSESETGEHRSLAPAKISGENVEVNFNYHYLLDALQAIPESKLFIGFNGQSKAALLRGFDSGSCFHLVMPMRIS